MTRRTFIYPFPDDDYATLARVMSAIDARHVVDLVDEPTGLSVVRVSTVAAAVYLRMAFEEARLTDRDGQPVLALDEVIIPDDQRDECERMLRETCPASATWNSIIQLTFDTLDAHRAFGRAYTGITGLPACLC